MERAKTALRMSVNVVFQSPRSGQLTLMLSLVGPVYAQRVALLIGNAKYAGAPLTNPPSDVSQMDAALKKVGFKAQALLDANQNQMKRALRDFGDQAQGAEPCLIPQPVSRCTYLATLKNQNPFFCRLACLGKSIRSVFGFSPAASNMAEVAVVIESRTGSMSNLA